MRAGIRSGVSPMADGLRTRHTITVNEMPETPISHWLLVPRDRNNGKFAGVCSAWAARHSVDPLVVRVILAALIFASGFGAVVYGTVWFLTPDVSGDKAPINRVLPQARNVSREIVEIAAAGFLGVYALVLLTFRPSTMMIVVLGIVVALGIQRSRRNQNPGMPPAPPTQGTPSQAPPHGQQPSSHGMPDQQAQRPFAEADGQQASSYHKSTVEKGAHRIADTTSAKPFSAASLSNSMMPPVPAAYFTHPDPAGLYGPEPGPLLAPTAAASTTVVRRSANWYIGLATTLAVIAWFVYVGIANAAVASGDATVVAAVSDTQAWSVAFTISAVGLIVGALLGKPHWLFVLTLVLGMSTGGSLAPIPTYVAPQDVDYVYSPSEELQSEFDIDTGQAVLDLRKLELESDETVRVSVGFGQVKVLLPEKLNTTVNYRIDVGEFETDSGTKSGMELSDSWQRTGPGPKLTLDISIDIGQVKIT